MLDNLKRKLAFFEQDNKQMKQHIGNIETSLTINKGIIDDLLKSANLQNEITKVVKKLKTDNENLYR